MSDPIFCGFEADELRSMGQSLVVTGQGGDDPAADRSIYLIVLYYPTENVLSPGAGIWDVLCNLGLRDRSPEDHLKFRDETAHLRPL